MLERYFAIEMPIWRFAFNTLIVSCAGIAPLLLIYVALTPGFGQMLLNDGFALQLLMRQVLTNGLVVVFIVNFLCFFLYASATARHGPDRAAKFVLTVDPVLRTVVFIGLHGLIYFFSADRFGSFGGDHWLALRVVGPTLASSAMFANLSGVYLYATIGSALPVYATAIGTLLAHRAAPPSDRRQFLPDRTMALLLGLVLFAIDALLLTGVALTIAYIQPS